MQITDKTILFDIFEELAKQNEIETIKIFRVLHTNYSGDQQEVFNAAAKRAVERYSIDFSIDIIHPAIAALEADKNFVVCIAIEPMFTTGSNSKVHTFATCQWIDAAFSEAYARSVDVSMLNIMRMQFGKSKDMKIVYDADNACIEIYTNFALAILGY